MKLFYSVGACSLSPHIVMRELGLPVSLEKVELKTGNYAGGKFKDRNPKGYVPALELSDGSLLTEGAVIVQYLADQKPGAGLVPAAGTLERYRCQEWLVYISSELHKGFSPFFSDVPAEVKAAAGERLALRLELVESRLRDHEYLMGNFTVADAYLFTVLNWSAFVKFDLARFPNCQRFLERMRARPAVQAALKAEGLK